MNLENKIFSALLMIVMIFIAGCNGENGNGPDNPANKVIAINGIYYKGTMGSNVLDKKLQFVVTDSEGKYIPDKQIQLYQFDGDGSIPKSTITDSTGIAEFTYGFSGTESVARLLLRADDSLDLEIHIRADALIPGAGGQGSYALFTDRYSDVKNFLGQPVNVDIIPGDHEIMYATYESTLGVVVMLYDRDLDKTVYDTSSVYGVIVNSIYDVTTQSSPPIGIGSTLDEIRSAYGAPDTIYFEMPRPEIIVRYSSLPAVFYCHWTFGMPDTLLEEIHFIEPQI